MAEKEIALLREQLSRLDDPKFELDAWKNHCLIFLERIFGKENTKLKLIRDLHYDYSSWSLRDTAAAGKTKDKDPVKMQAREILEATITELEHLGLPSGSSNSQKVWELLQDELTGRQIKEIESILNSEDSAKPEKIGSLLEKLEKDSLAGIISKLLLNA